MRYQFIHDDRLGIPLPYLEQEWEEYLPQERAEILLTWEEIRARIPDRIIQLEKVINDKQGRMFEEDDFNVSCQLNSEISELASIINDLNIWFRVDQDYGDKAHQ